MKIRRCNSCTRKPLACIRKKEYHPSMRVIYMRTGTRRKLTYIPVGYICPNCGDIQKL